MLKGRGDAPGFVVVGGTGVTATGVSSGAFTLFAEPFLEFFLDPGLDAARLGALLPGLDEAFFEPGLDGAFASPNVGLLDPGFDDGLDAGFFGVIGVLGFSGGGTDDGWASTTAGAAPGAGVASTAGAASDESVGGDGSCACSAGGDGSCALDGVRLLLLELWGRLGASGSCTSLATSSAGASAVGASVVAVSGTAALASGALALGVWLRLPAVGGRSSASGNWTSLATSESAMAGS